MRAPFGLHFVGQVGTFIYLTQTMRLAPEFDMTAWPQFSIYNVLVANFWPLYWGAHFFDAAKLQSAYWHVFEVADQRVADLYNFAQYFIG